jgi:hypothetical protein
MTGSRTFHPVGRTQVVVKSQPPTGNGQSGLVQKPPLVRSAKGMAEAAGKPSLSIKL